MCFAAVDGLPSLSNFNVDSAIVNRVEPQSKQTNISENVRTPGFSRLPPPLTRSNGLRFSESLRKSLLKWSATLLERRRGKNHEKSPDPRCSQDDGIPGLPFGLCSWQMLAPTSARAHVTFVRCPAPVKDNSRRLPLGRVRTASTFIHRNSEAIGRRENTVREMREGGSYVSALTRKYGAPKVERRTYRNGLGNEFHGNVWTWTRNRSSLEIDEICVANFSHENLSNIPCLLLWSDEYAPKQAAPQI